MKPKLLSAIATILMVLVLAAAAPLTIPKIFGLEVYSVLTSSMTPALPVGSAIYVRPCEASCIASGEIITFGLGSGTDLVETHRVVTNNTETHQITTKGDANAQPDVTQVNYDRVIGKVMFCIPILGSVSEFFHSISGIVFCVAIFALALILWTLADNIKKRESSK